jgi:hypothetical protein
MHVLCFFLCLKTFLCTFTELVDYYESKKEVMFFEVAQNSYTEIIFFVV